MGQREIIQFLESSSKPLSARQIADAIQEDFNAVCHNLRKLLKWNEVKSFEINRIKAQEYLEIRISRRVRVYFNASLDFKERDLDRFINHT